MYAPPVRGARCVIPFTGDRIATAAALCASSADAHVLYESGDAVAWAEGERIVVEAHGDRILVRGKDIRCDVPVVGDPVTAMGVALRQVDIGDRHVYGWVSFEACGGGSAQVPVARMVVPHREIHFDGDSCSLFADNEQDLETLTARLRRAGTADSLPVTHQRVPADGDEHGCQEYLGAVGDAVRAIRGGALEKVIVSRVVPVARPIDLPATYLAGRRANAPARSFLLRLGGWEAAGFSPEIVARVTADGTVITQPLAGTRALTGNEHVDSVLRTELLRDPKEIFEHAVSVRLAVLELAGVCAPDTVCVTNFMTVKERGSVQHLASEIAGRLRPGLDAWAALAAVFPAVTASGIPKHEARELLRRLETRERGLYAGAVVMADAAGALDAALVLRTVFRRDGHTWLQAGAGIVAQSTPERELEETREKLASVGRHLVPPAPTGTVASP